MKRINIIACSLLLALTHNLQANSYAFNWTATGASQYNGVLYYSGGTTVNGIFTPTGLISYSFGTPLGTVNQQSQYPAVAFYTDTPVGPSFNVQGAIKPIDYENFAGYNLGFYFQGQTEVISYYDTKLESDINLTGNWTETIIPAPDVANSGLLLATALAALGAFHALRRGASVNPKSGLNP